jgi:glutathione S-transferase
MRKKSRQYCNIFLGGKPVAPKSEHYNNLHSWTRMSRAAGASGARCVFLSTSSRRGRRHGLVTRASHSTAPFAVSGSDDEALLTFFTHSLCPYAHRVSLALAEKRVSHERVHIDLSNKPRSFLERNPRGLVPAVEKPDGEVLVESLDLIEWIDASFDGPSLVPEGKAGEVASFIRSCDSSFVSPCIAFVGGGWGFSRGDAGEAATLRMAEAVEKLARLVVVESDEGAAGPFLLGSTSPSLADLAVYPFAERFEIASREFRGVELRDLPRDDALRDAYDRWSGAMRDLDSTITLRPNEDALLAAWRRTMRLDYFDYETADVDKP